MSIYPHPTKTLMADWARQYLQPGQVFGKAEPVRWFTQHYPKIKRTTVNMHVEGMSVNNRNRRHYPNVKPGSGHDIFFKLGPDRYRLWNKETDPAPLYKPDIEALLAGGNSGTDVVGAEEADNVNAAEAAQEFALESHLRDYLAKNLGLIEPGLLLYSEEEINGIEFDAGGRFIDILAVDSNGAYVVIELKVARGYDRVIGQLLRYIAWVEQNMGSAQLVRGIIVANHITDDLKLAASRLPDVRLVEYKLSFQLAPV